MSRGPSRFKSFRSQPSSCYQPQGMWPWKQLGLCLMKNKKSSEKMIMGCWNIRVCHLLILDIQFLLSKVGDHAVRDLMESLIPSCRKYVLSTCLVPQCVRYSEQNRKKGCSFYMTLTVNEWVKHIHQIITNTLSTWYKELLLLLSCFSCVRLCVTPWTAAYQAPLSMGFSRQEYCSGVPLPSLIQRADSLEKTTMLGKIEGRRRERHRMRWLDGWMCWIWVVGKTSIATLRRSWKTETQYNDRYLAWRVLVVTDASDMMNIRVCIKKKLRTLQRNKKTGRESFQIKNTLSKRGWLKVSEEGKWPFETEQGSDGEFW